MHAISRIVVPLLTLVLAACGDTTSSVGELGRLRYSLHTDYEVPEYELTDARIVTGHRQTINVTMTRKGRGDVDKPADITHRIEPSDGVTIATRPAGHDDNAPGFEITITIPGDYKIFSNEGDDEVDRIGLKFETPSSFEMIMSRRGPYESGFTSVGAGSMITVVEGTQITVDAAPLDSGGSRLAGKMQTTVTVDPSWMAVPGVGVIESYEDGVWASDGQANFYFIEPGLASITVSDSISGASGMADFDVTPIPKTP